jgi:DNA-directed RNA polymerase specialized sigma24 family protein
MKWLVARIAANTVLRGENARNRIARWSQWFPRTPTVDDSRFQTASDPYPRHWRAFPAEWPAFDPTDPAVKEGLAAALDGMPDRWRDVAIARDIRHLSPAEVSEQLGISLHQQRAMLNRARAIVRASLAHFFVARSDNR